MTQPLSPILIVGAGPVGLTTALALTQQSIPCRIIDKKPEAEIASKASGIHPRTLEVFEHLGIIKSFETHGLPINTLNFYSNCEPIARLVYGELDSPYSYMISIPQHKTEAILTEALQQLNTVIEWNVALTHLEQHDNSVSITLKHSDDSIEKSSTRWLVACDGIHSTTRQLVDLKFTGKRRSNEWALAEGHIQWPFQNKEIFIFNHNEGLLECLPLPNGNHRIMFIRGKYRPKALRPPPLISDFRRCLITRAHPDAMIDEIHEIYPFHIPQRQISHYRKGRVLLIGDAAHTHSPAIGQGINAGVQDAFNLAWKLALEVKSIGKRSIIDTYHNERYPVAKHILTRMDKLINFFAPTYPLLQKSRDHFVKYFGQSMQLQNLFAKQYSGIKIHYRSSAIVHNAQPRMRQNILCAGNRAPDLTLVSLQDKQEQRLFELLSTSEHTLLLFHPTYRSPKKLSLLINELVSFQHKYPTLVQGLIILSQQKEPDTFIELPCYYDQRMQMKKLYAIQKTSLVLIRPDGYIGLFSQPAQSKHLNTYFESILTPQYLATNSQQS